MISIPELALLAFAGYRCTQLAVHDTILDPARAVVFDWHSRKTDSSLRTGRARHTGPGPRGLVSNLARRGRGSSATS